MSSKPQPDSSNSSSKDGSASRQSLPFEPKKSRKQVEKSPAQTPSASQFPEGRIAPAKVEKKAEKPAAAKSAPSRADRINPSSNRPTVQQTAIPDAVSRRMIKRMALLCGIPSALGMSTFIVSYLLVVNDLFEVPTYAVLLVSLGWFGLGVLGLSYGVLSASWDEETGGSLVGWSEFTTNVGRMTSAWRSTKAASKDKT